MVSKAFHTAEEARHTHKSLFWIIPFVKTPGKGKPIVTEKGSDGVGDGTEN